MSELLHTERYEPVCLTYIYGTAEQRRGASIARYDVDDKEHGTGNKTSRSAKNFRKLKHEVGSAEKIKSYGVESKILTDIGQYLGYYYNLPPLQSTTCADPERVGHTLKLHFRPKSLPRSNC